jgi:hypothetical protein
MNLKLACLAAAAALMTAAPAWAERPPPKVTTLSDGQLTVEVVDMSPRFLAFYAAAKSAPDADARFKLWQDLYGFAAVPPTAEGQAMARRLIDQAWPNYAKAVPLAEAGAAGMQPAPLPILHRVAEVLKLDAPAKIQLVTYIGGFEDNAFSFRGKTPTVAIPLEIDPAVRTRSLAHEGTHAVHMLLANLSGGWQRSVAATMLQEGLAMEVSREVAPGQPLEAYLSNRPGWVAEARAKDRVILAGLKDKLAASDSEAVSSVTIRKGAKSGVEREAYWGGWRVVTRMRQDGMSLAEIARIPEAEMPARVGQVLDELLAE